MEKTIVRYKTRRQMHDYQGLHSGVPYVRLHVPQNEIWLRKDICKRNPKRCRRILGHEQREKRLMDKGMNYKTAHLKAGYKP
jgi:hypothetical protein